MAQRAGGKVRSSIFCIACNLSMGIEPAGNKRIDARSCVAAKERASLNAIHRHSLGTSNEATPRIEMCPIAKVMFAKRSNQVACWGC